MPGANCPSRDELSAFLAGRLNEPAIERVADHLEHCAPCREVVETLDVKGDTLASQLRIPAAAQPLAIPAACERAMAAAEKLLDSSSSADAETNLNLPAIVRIRDYRILEKRGEGGMGAVYKAIHERLERIVAIKVLTPARLRDSQGVSRFQREMKAVGKLQHPNIVSAHDAGEADGMHFLVMEYVEGMDLGALIARLGPLAVADACELIRQAALGLEHVHQHGLVHRDIKPSNLMLTTAGQVKILDLGLALLHDPQQPAGAELTATSQLMGTADYVSPEQAENTHGVDIRADLYSLGCTLYKLLTGQAPFSGKEFDTPLKKIMAHVQRTPPALDGRRAGLPAGLVALVDRLLAKDPAKRYATPAEVAAALVPFAGGSDLSGLGALAVSHPAAPPYRCDERLPPDGTTREHLSSALVDTDRGRRRASRGAAARWWRDRRVQIAAGGLAGLLFVFGIVLMIKTPAGTIVLTIDQPEIAGAEVTVDDQKMITIRTGVGDEPINVTADEKEHQLKVTKGGFETFTQKFTVRKGKNPPIEVKLLPRSDVAHVETKAPPESAAWHGWPADAPPPAIAPFTAEQAQQHQKAWAKYLGVPVEFENSVGVRLRFIPPGESKVGSSKEEIDDSVAKAVAAGQPAFRVNFLKEEGPQRLASMDQPYYLGVHEVTQKAWQSVMGKNPSTHRASDDLPVADISWLDAVAFCNLLSERERRRPGYRIDGDKVEFVESDGYRLPVVEEWEYACRAGSATRYFFGDDPAALGEYAWFRENSSGLTHPVGRKLANAFGLHDIYGNVCEVVQRSKTATMIKWQPQRGMAYFSDAAVTRSAATVSGLREERADWVGVRVLLPVSRAAATGSHRPVVVKPDSVETPTLKGDPTSAPPVARHEPDQVVDLLKLVNIERDAVHGIWTISSSGLAVDGKASYARVKLPYTPPAEYDFRIEFTAQGGNDILQLFTVGGRTCTFLMGAWGGRYDGFDTVKDHPLTREGTNIVGGPTSVRGGQRHTSVVQVRRDFIAATIDGKLVVRHATNGSDLGIPGPWSIGPSAIGLGSTYDPVIFHKVELVVPAATAAGWHGWPTHAPKPAIVPFDAAQARRHQEAWAAHLEAPVESENSIGMKFRLIPPGEFVMGRSPRDDEVVGLENLAHDDLPPHEVTLTKPFAIGMTEVTQKQWKEVMGTTPWQGKKMAVDDESRPVTYVSWFDAEKFCQRLSEREGETYRLATEAEWEFACRGGTSTAFSFGDNVSYLPDYAWTRGNSQDLPHPVATKKPNPWGLYDMHGNTWEWCDARFVPYSGAAVVDPQSEGDVTFRPLRGGCFWSVPNGDYRSAVRRRWPEGLGYPESGFRVVRAVRKAQ